MKKPDWYKAPKWAQYLAQDADGRWFWHEEMPVLLEDTSMWFVPGTGRFKLAATGPCWKDTLEKRPEGEGGKP